MTANQTIVVGFLIFPGFPMACLTSIIEPLRAANEISGQKAFNWKMLSERPGRVMSSADVGFDAETALSDVDDLDALFMLSSPMAKFDDPRNSHGKLRSLERHGVVVGGISGGVFPLVRSGLMDGYACSVHWCYGAAFRAEFPEADASDDVIVMDGRRHTASGAAAAFDLALHLIEKRLGADIATEVACWFQHPLLRGKGIRQRIPTLNQPDPSDRLPDPVEPAIRLFARHIEVPISVQKVANQVGVSPRHLERAFKKHTGQSPSHYYRALRMKAARQLVVYSKDSVAEIALAVGYSSATPLLQHYCAAFGISPQEDRASINQFRVDNNAIVPST
ncbi:MAG: GlxA family transcriptional regulator [Stappiaceae bacterium]